MTDRSKAGDSDSATADPGPADPRAAGEPDGGRYGRGRLLGVDAARALALLGMMAIHIFPDRDDDGSISAVYQVASGRSAATFAVLAGVGLALANRRLAPPGPAEAAAGWSEPPVTYRVAAVASLIIRGLAIGVIGLMLGPLDSGVAVILPYYALLFILAAPLLRMRTAELAGLAVVVALVVPVASHLLRDSLPHARGDNATVLAAVTAPGRLFTELTLTGYYPALAWLTYLAAGLAVGRLRLGSPKVAAGLLAGGSVLALAAATGSWLVLGPLGGAERIAASTGMEPGSALLNRMLSQSRFGTTPTTTWWWLGVDAPHSSTPFDLLETTGIALAVLGFALIVCRAAGRVAVPLAAAGSMTLTLYCAHVLGLSSDLLPADPLASWLISAGAALGLALAWRSARRRGPLESVVAAMARQPFGRVP